MTYNTGQTIAAADYNGFVNTVNSVIGNSASYRSGSGYGQTSLSTVSATDTVAASSWGTLITAVKTAAQHQGTSIDLPASNPSAGDTITAFDGSVGSDTFNLTSAVADINTNSANVDAGQQTTIAGSQASSRGSVWGSGGSETIQAEVYVQFASQVATDAWFNTGGEIHITFQHASGSTDQDNNWRDIFNNKIGTFKLGKTATSRTGNGGTIAAFGYTSLTSSYQNIYTGTNIGGGAYAANDTNIEAYLNESNHRLYLRFTHVDQSTAIAPSTADEVAAGTAVSIGFRKSTVYAPATPSVTQSSSY
tara:strand:+ start:521 stop:1438 length:918 start_codon:yes stop_codon:yes gene_type:complete